ncbi:MAG: efflux RND transporter permease subunit [Magnetococcales bacterium]|nr:efflux RND transporter permease subunit [Magnetococcales bacterium]
MNIPAFFVHRPVTTVLTMTGLLLLGLLSYHLLPVAALPSVDYPTLQVSASLTGASPDTMANSVALPLEKEFSTIAGLETMTSTSSLGSTQISLQFTLDRDIDAAAQDVQAAISSAQRRLPNNMTSSPSYRKVNPADLPIFYLALTSATLPLTEISEFADTTLSQSLSVLPGVAQVNIYGRQTPAVRVKVNPDRLAANNLSLEDVEQAIQSNNPNLPSGFLINPERMISLETPTREPKGTQYRSIVITQKNGLPLRLDEVAQVIDGAENDLSAAWFNATRGVVLAIQRQPGSNTIAVSDAIASLLPTLREQLPAATELIVMFDRSQSIRESVRDVQLTLIFSLALVVLVTYLFLGNASATLIPSLAIPLSLVGVFPLMLHLDMSINIISLMALTLSVGFVVDDAIVMMENIIRNMEEGKSPWQATLDGGRQIAFTIISMTLSIAAVFIPVLFMEGILGRLLHEFSVAIIATVILSGVISLSLTPMLCSRILRRHDPAQANLLIRGSEAVFLALRRGYARSLDWSLRHRRTVVFLFLLMAVGTIQVGYDMPKGFMPSEDTGSLFCFTEAEQDIGFEAMKERQRRLAEIINADPAVQTTMSFIGGGSTPSSLNNGRIFIRLKPLNQRPHADEIVKRLRPQLVGVPGIKAFIQNIPSIRIGTRLTKSQYQFTLQGTDTRELYHWTDALEKRLREAPGFLNVTTDMQLAKTQALITIDRDKAAILGITPERLEQTLYLAYGPKQIATLQGSSNQYPLLLELDDRYRTDPSLPGSIRIRGAGDTLVPLDAIATIERTVGPSSISHQGQLPAVTISFDLAPGRSLSQAIETIDALRATLGMPGAISASFQGSAQVFQSSMTGMGWLLGLAVLVIYLVLGMLYESYVHPLTILSGLPAAALGALLTLKLFDMELNLFSYVGLIMLIGIVKKNAIMMVDFAIEAQRTTCASPLEAIRQACLVRFRPIMMTTMAALVGTLPIALGWGAGGEARQPLGIAVVGGLVLSQWLTLYITPVIFLYLEKIRPHIDPGLVAEGDRTDTGASGDLFHR